MSSLRNAFLALLMIVPTLCDAAVAYVREKDTVTFAGAACTLSATSYAAGDDVVVFIMTADATAPSATTIPDDNSAGGANDASWIIGPTQANGAGTVRVSSFYLLNAPASATSMVITADATPDNGFCVLSVHTGVVAFANTAYSPTTSSATTTHSTSMTIQDADNWVVVGMAAPACVTYTSTVGNARGRTNNSCNAGTAIVALMSDNTAGSPSSVANTATTAANQSSAFVAIELRSQISATNAKNCTLLGVC